ncbi:MAG: type II toxin-antitoxin system VapC family toxin [Acidobacteriota bacterium]
MERSLILETTFLVDLERELIKETEGAANWFLERHLQHQLYLTFTIAGELAAGPTLVKRQGWEDFLAPFRILPMSKDVCWEYGKTYRYLRDNGMLIGSNDIWIAATALAYSLPLVTANRRHFRRVPGLAVESYS